MDFDLNFDLGFDLLSADFEFKTEEIDGITLSQVCDTIEKENTGFEGLQWLSLSQVIGEFDLGANAQDMDVPADESTDSRFGNPVSENDISDLLKNQENVNTRNNTKWAANLFEKWRLHRKEDIPQLHEMNSTEMSFWLERFVMEARKKDGKEYPPRSLYLILCGLLRLLRDHGAYDKNFLDEKNSEFAGFRKVVDARMKRLIDKGLWCDVKQADPVLPDDEAKLWESGVFGKENSEQLQHTIFFYACKLFGLRGCDEHHSLKCEQFKIGEDGEGRYIQFLGRSTKTYKGGLGHFNVQSKNLKHHSQSGDRCMVDYFQVYLEALGGSGPFYRRPLPPISENSLRFSQQVVGVNELKTFMKTIAQKGNLKGNFTNHSGKRTCATQMYIAGIPEQEIMRRTGHRSEQSVRKYKRSTEQMAKNVSKVLDPPPLDKMENCESTDEPLTKRMRITDSANSETSAF